MNRSKIWFFMTWIFTGSCLLLFLSGCKEQKVEEAAPVVRPVKTIIVGDSETGVRTYPGMVQAADRVELSFRVGGPLIEIPVREGERVRKGRLLARIDPRDYQIALDRAKAEFARAESDYKRYQKLYETDAVPLADLELRQAQRDVAKSNLDNARADLNDTYLKAPFTGEIGERYFEIGEDLRPKQRVLSLHGTKMVEIIVNVPETGKARFDSEWIETLKIIARFTFAPDRAFDLTLTEFSASADPRTQTYRATFQMPQPEGVNIQPGMTADVVLSGLPSGTSPSTRGFIIPAVAVFAGDDGAQNVWVVNETDMTVHRTGVKAGTVTGTADITILSGLSAGDRIVVAGVTTLREGMKVSLLEDHFAVEGGRK